MIKRVLDAVFPHDGVVFGCRGLCRGYLTIGPNLLTSRKDPQQLFLAIISRIFTCRRKQDLLFKRNTNWIFTFVLESKLCLSLANFFLCNGSPLFLRVKRTLTMTMKIMKMTVIETITTMWLGEMSQLERASGGQTKVTSLHFPSVNANSFSANLSPKPKTPNT